MDLGFGFGLNQGGASWTQSFPYLLNGVAPALTADFGRGRYAINGVAKSIDDIVMMSSGAKWVLGQDEVLFQVPGNTPALDYSSGARQLMLECASTNYIANNTLQGAVVSGALPTGHSSLLVSGISVQVAAISNIGGREYIDLRFYGTAGVSGQIGTDFSGTTAVPAVAGETWTLSSWCSVLSGTAPGTPFLFLMERTSAGGFVNGSTTNLGLSDRRLSVTRVFSGGTTAYAHPSLRVAITAGQTCDFILRIALPQLEKTSLMTSIIKTYGSAVSRVTDICQLTPAAAAAFQGSAASVVWRGDVKALASVQQLIGFSFGEALVRSGGVGAESTIVMDGSTASAIAFAGSSLPGSKGVVVGYDAASRKCVANDGSVVTSASPADSPKTSVFLGSSAGMLTGSAHGIKELDVWTILGSDTEFTAQARVYA